MFKFCPTCASQNIRFEQGKVFRCPDCGFVYYHNIAAATGCIINVPDSSNPNGIGRLLFLVRGKEPALGKLDLPGGFVDPGEGALEGLYRELKEELNWVPPLPQGSPSLQAGAVPDSPTLTKIFTLFASYPNVYLYKNIFYNTCDMFFYHNAPGLCEQNLFLEKAEIAGVRFLRPDEINYDDLAFDSTRKAVKAFLQITNNR